MRFRRSWPVLALLAVLFLLGQCSKARLSITYDEPFHLAYGMRVMTGDTNRFDDSKMPVSALNALPLTFTGIGEREFFAIPDPIEYVRTARNVTVWASLALALIVFGWAAELYGYAAGLLALGLYVFEPNLLAHSQLVTTDLYAVLFITLALYTFWRFLAKGGKGRLVVSALGLGLAQIAKYSAAYLYPIFLLLGLVWWWRQPDRRTRWKSFGGAVLVYVAASLAVINLGFLGNKTLLPWGDYPFKSSLFQNLQRQTSFLSRAPVPLPFPYVQGLDLVKYGDESGTGFGKIYLLGEVRSNQGFLSYYFVAFLFKTPLGLQLLLLLALLNHWRNRAARAFLRDELILLVPVVFFTAYFNFFFKAQIGIRYFLVVYPLLIVFTGSLLSAWPQVGRRARLVVAALAAWMVVSNLSYYGHYLSYFNELVGARKNSYRILADSNLDWGQNTFYRRDYLAEHPDVTWLPPTPRPGRFIVDANIVVGINTDRPGGWTKAFTPVGHVAYSYLLFDISAADLASATLPRR